jgi:glutathione-specific gamma-glutamylcyclotransferase
MTVASECWVFGYGSLMWRPGFEYHEAEPALLHGHHRALCVYSHVYRGTPERPGLVMGLDRGGSCHGMAFRIDPGKWDETVSYLRAREQITMVYVEARRPVRLLRWKHRPVTALTYLVDRNHQQYCGSLGDAEILRHVRQGQGKTGSCLDYVRATHDHLRAIGIRDRRLERLVSALESQD